jgi:hypothetical protein
MPEKPDPNTHKLSLLDGEIVEESDLGSTRRVTASVSAYSREVLVATFNVHLDNLPKFPFTNTDPLIVNRINPFDSR